MKNIISFSTFVNENIYGRNYNLDKFGLNEINNFNDSYSGQDLEWEKFVTLSMALRDALQLSNIKYHSTELHDLAEYLMETWKKEGFEFNNPNEILNTFLHSNYS